jgi:hypothetical protein
MDKTHSVAASALIIGVAALTAMSLAGCEKKAASIPAGPPVGQDNPNSLLGKTAKMARETKSQIDGQQAAMGALADQVGGKAGETAAANMDSGATFLVSGITFTAPKGWQRGPGSTFRAAEFTAPGGVSVAFFTSGGTVEGNIERWRSQVQGEKSPSENKFKQEKATIAGVTVHTVTMEGSYAGMDRSGAAALAAPGTRFIGIIFEGSPGPVQIRMTGPAAAVKEAEPTLKALLEGMKVSR